MDDKDLLEFYQYRIFRKIEKMQHTERAAFMADLFGKSWTEVYDRLVLLYPALVAPNATLSGSDAAGGRSA